MKNNNTNNTTCVKTIVNHNNKLTKINIPHQPKTLIGGGSRAKNTQQHKTTRNNKYTNYYRGT